MMALPDFLVAGVPKAGTTALHAALSRHPGLFLSPVKEPKFFLTDGPPPARGGPGDALTYREHVWQRDRYEALFDAAPPGAQRGEATPFYLYDAHAMRRIHDLIPDVKLIVIIRDPVERAHSNWTHLWSAGLEPVGDFVQACAEEERRIAAGWAPFWHYTGLGRYGEQLARAFSAVPARATARAPLPPADRRRRTLPWTGSATFLGVQAGPAHRDPPGERHRAPGAHARSPRRLPRHARERCARPPPARHGRHRRDPPARALPAAPMAGSASRWAGSSARRCCPSSKTDIKLLGAAA